MKNSITTDSLLPSACIDGKQMLCAVYFRICTYEAGIANTGSRSANYHCYCEILDNNKNAIKNHALSDVFYGRWSKCQTVINNWQRKCEKSKLSRIV